LGGIIPLYANTIAIVSLYLSSFIKESWQKYFGGVILFYTNVNAVVALLFPSLNLYFNLYSGSYLHSYGTSILFLSKYTATVLP